MGKISLQDLASVLVERWHLGKKEASMFVNEMFFVIQKSLDEDKIVKVKGLGTFKIIDVDDRESVDVNTGDRVLIEGHGKITFTPDALMKELVNKPFSQFETVVLNEGVDFNDAAANQPEETTGDVLGEIEDSSAPLVEFVDESHDEESVEQETPKPEPVAVADLPKEEETATEDISEEITESDTSQETPQEVSEEASEGVEETEGTGESEETEENVVIEDLEEGPGFKKYLKWIGLVLLALAVFLIGYLAGRGPKTTPQEPKTEIVKNDTVKNLPNDSDTVDMQTEVEEESLEDEEVADDDEETMEDEEEAKEEERPLDKWEAMDARVKTGAYRIIGTDTVVKAKAGDNLTRIGNRLLGPGMECYLEVYNGLSAGAVLSAGQEIKIPKVDLKKKQRKIE